MKFKIILGLLFLTASISINAQQIDPQDAPQKSVSGSTVKKTEDSKSDDSKTDTYVRPDAKKRQKDYINSIFGPVALARTVAGAGISTWRNSPEEWGGQWEGFGRRVASNFGKNAIRQTVVYTLDESFKLDSKFYRSKKRSLGSKVKNALISPVTARNANGKRVLGVPRIVGTYMSSVVAAEAWYPKRYDYKDGLRSGTISLGLNAVVNLFRELIKK